jgi:hypothetical protein
MHFKLNVVTWISHLVWYFYLDLFICVTRVLITFSRSAIFCSYEDINFKPEWLRIDYRQQSNLFNLEGFRNEHYWDLSLSNVFFFFKPVLNTCSLKLNNVGCLNIILEIKFSLMKIKLVVNEEKSLMFSIK